MNRLACVDVPVLPLQILLRRHPEWREEPVAVVAEDRARVRIRWVNRRGIALGVRPGMRQAAAVACCPALRIGEVRSPEVARETSRLAERLGRWSPQVESASNFHPFVSGFGAAGTFWLRASGLAGLFGPLPQWSQALRKDLAADGFQASVAVGFTRFGAFAAARARFGEQLFESPAEERRAARQAPLVRFGLPGRTLAELERLGIRSLGELRRLSGKGLGKRFGNEVAELHRLASGEIPVFTAPVRELDTPVERRISFEPPETDSERLLFQAKRLLDQILGELGERGLAVTELAYEVDLEDEPSRFGSVLPALPAEDGVRLLSLLRLRLEADASRDSRRDETAAGDRSGRRPEPRITGLLLRARGGVFVSEPGSLYLSAGRTPDGIPHRDRNRAAEALARVQAEFGENCLVRVETRDAHLPRGRYRCRAIPPKKAIPRRPPGNRLPERLVAAVRGKLPTGREDSPGPGSPAVRSEIPAPGRERPARSRAGPAAEKAPLAIRSSFPDRTPARLFPKRSLLGARLVRRIYEQPILLPHRSSGEPDGWLLQGVERGPVQGFTGPYRISGGWWRLRSGRAITRDYFFVRLKRGEVCWVFFDRERRSWFLEGRVE